MSNITKIKISGTSYNIKDENACNVVELTQAEYDALPASAKTSNSLFVITDAQGADLSNYYTKSETSGATEISTALASKQTTLTAGTGIEITNDVISVSGVVMSSEVTSAVTSDSTDVVTSGGVYDQLGGMKIVKLTESEYTALVTKDDDTLYCVVPDPSN